MTFVAAKACTILLLTSTNLIFHIDASTLIRGATIFIHGEWLIKNPR